MKGARPGSERGASLIELVVSLLVLSIAMLGVLVATSRSAVHSADPLLERQALAIASAYLEEILVKRFDDPPGGDTGGRPGFDDVLDYDGLDDAGAVDQDGVAIAGLEPYRVRVAVDSAATLHTLGAGQVRRIDVRVTHTNLVDLTLSGYRTPY